MHADDATTTVCLYCRPGMESDCAAEIVDQANRIDVPGWCRTGDGHVEFTAGRAGDVVRLARHIRFSDLVFTRQWFAVVAHCEALPPTDRATPLAAALAKCTASFSDLRVEYPDSDAGRPLARLARSLAHPLRQALVAQGVTASQGGPVAHAFLLSGERAIVGLSDAANSSPWPLGIPRLKLPGAAPSRSVLKLEEAFGLFLNDDERAAWLRPGRTAVDLGAAPGGWSWLLAERGLKVDAVDNASLAPVLTGHPRVFHHRADGFRFRPRRTVDWLVCDMVERPQRIAALAARWLADGLCRHVVCNLKLPMKKRWQTVCEQLDVVRAALPAEGRLAARQLYHDRDEVTLFASRSPLAHRTGSACDGATGDN